MQTGLMQYALALAGNAPFSILSYSFPGPVFGTAPSSGEQARLGGTPLVISSGCRWGS
jgi:hypothetical protein